MTGVLDSGAGGVLTAKILSALCPRTDVLLLADRKNAPYGTRCDEEIIEIAERGISRLLSSGAERVLIACCTASSLYPRFAPKIRGRSIPIIAPTAARAAELTKSGRIGVLATRATVRGGAFSREIKRILPSAEVFEREAGELVGLVESGVRDGASDAFAKRKIIELTQPLIDEGIDTLVLGCTHFPYLYGSFKELFEGISIASCAHEGARAAAELSAAKESGKVRYTE